MRTMSAKRDKSFLLAVPYVVKLRLFHKLKTCHNIGYTIFASVPQNSWARCTSCRFAVDDTDRLWCTNDKILPWVLWLAHRDRPQRATKSNQKPSKQTSFYSCKYWKIMQDFKWVLQGLLTINWYLTSICPHFFIQVLAVFPLTLGFHLCTGIQFTHIKFVFLWIFFDFVNFRYAFCIENCVNVFFFRHDCMLLSQLEFHN